MIDKIKEIASRVFETEVNDQTSQANCDKWDSLHHLSLVVELEMEFDISLEPEEIAEMKSIAAISALIEHKLS